MLCRARVTAVLLSVRLQMQSSQDMITKYLSKERSPATRERPRLTVPLPAAEREPPVCHSPPTPASSSGDLRPKSILKKTNSSLEPEPPASPLSLGRADVTPPDPDTAV